MNKKDSKNKSSRIKEIADITYGERGTASEDGMVRTQIYLTQDEHAFLLKEAKNRGTTMAALIRKLVDDRMEIRDDIWSRNSLLDAVPDEDASAEPEDASINLDHYLYGLPRAYEKVDGRWVKVTDTPV